MPDVPTIDEQSASPVATKANLRPVFQRLAGWSVFGCIVIAALIAGLIVRRWAWDQTEPIRYTSDINNAFRQGTMALQTGYIDRYDEQQTRAVPEGSGMDLDYGPGRLAIATIWTHWVREKVDGKIVDPKTIRMWQMPFYTRARSLHQPYELVHPMLMVNLTSEILSAIAMFLLVQRYTSGKPKTASPGVSRLGYRYLCARLAPIPLRGNILGLLAALFFWFDPGLICNAHCWPQWDSWVMPFFLWAVVMASWDYWFTAGAIIACGAMFKGQSLFGAPLFLLWPLFQGRLPAIGRWIVGLLTAVAIITGVWSLRIPGTNPSGRLFLPGSISHPALQWCIVLAAIFTVLGVYTRWRRQQLIQNSTPILLGIMALMLIVIFIPLHVPAGDWIKLLIIAVTALALLLTFASRKVLPFAFAFWISAAVLLCVPIYDTSHGWFDLGIAYGTHHFERMASGQIDNLPELLQERWGWDNLMEPVVTIPKGPTADSICDFLNQIDPGVHLHRGHEIGLPLKYFLVCIWLIAVVLSAAAAARHDRNRSPRFLAAIVAPWIVFFAVMTQMHQRYLLWGGSLSAATSVLSPGYFLLHLFLSVVSMSQELQSMMNNIYDYSGKHYTDNAVYQFLTNWHPGIGWAVLLTAGIFLYTALKWEKRAA